MTKPQELLVIESFKIGDVIVTLNSGGPDMTIVDVVGKGNQIDMAMSYEAHGFKKGFIICNRFDGTSLKKDGFPPEALTLKSS